MRKGKGTLFRGMLFGSAIAIPLLLAGSVAALDGYCSAREDSRFCEGLTGYFLSKLVRERHVPEGGGGIPDDRTMIYVLGGNQVNLSGSYKVAAGLYHRNVSRRIHVLSRAGITEFSPERGRNLTNDEWSVRELEALGVKPRDIVPVAVPDNWFGTLGEGETVTGIARRNGSLKLVLVSSALHTRRVFDTFRSMVPPGAPEVYVYGAETRPDLKDLIKEYIKLLSYDFVALPARKFLESR